MRHSNARNNRKGSASVTSRGFAIGASVLMVLSVIAVVAPSAAGAVNFGSYGSFIDSKSDKDFVPTLTEPGTADLCIGYVNSPSAPTDPSKRAWFFHIDGTGGCDDATVQSSRSFRYTTFAGSASPKWMTPSDTEFVGRSWTLLQDLDGNAAVCYLETDGMPGFSIGDPVYYDADGDGQISINDFRMAAVSTSELSSVSTSMGIVKSTDSDLTTAQKGDDDPTKRPTGVNYAGCGGSWDAKALDMGSLGTLDSSDDFYLGHGDLLTTNYGSIGLLRLTASSGTTAGKKVLDNNNDQVDFLETLDGLGGTTGQCDATCQVQIVRTNPTETDMGSQNLYFHFPNPGSSDDVISVNDLVLRRNQPTESSSGSPGQLVTSTSNGAGATIGDATRYAPEDLIFFIDQDGDGAWDSEGTPKEPVYIKHPSNVADGSIYNNGDAGCHGGAPTGNQRCLEINDVRLLVDGKTSGSLVQAGDSDFSAFKSGEGYTGAVVKLFSSKDDTRTPLKTVSQGKFWDKNKNNVWDPATEDVFVGAMTNDSDATTYRQVWTGGAAAWNAVTCPAFGNPCGGTNLDTTSHVKTTGPDGTYDGPGADEFLYWSEDAFLTVGDYRMGQLDGLPSGQVATGDAALGVTLLQSTGTTLYATFDTTADFPTTRAIKLYPSFGTRLTSSSSEVVPSLTQVNLATSVNLVRLNLGQVASFNDDTYVLDFSKACTAGQMLRVTPHSNGAAGTFLTDTDTTETTTCQNAPAGDIDSDISDAFGFIESGSTGGFSSDDFVYLDNGGIGGTAGLTLTTFDARVTPVSLSGSTLQAGSLVLSADSDRQTFGGDALADTGNHIMLWWDANFNGIVDKDDMLYLRNSAVSTGPTTAPAFLDVRLIGTGGASGGGGGGGGGGTTTPPPTTTPPSISISQPSAGSYHVTGETVSISGTASGGSASISSVSVTVDGQSVSVSGTSSWSTSFTPATDGSYSISATVTATNGQTASASRTFNANAAGEAPADSDGDGIPDDEDDCPDTAGLAANNGCPESAVDEQARQDAAEAKQSAEEAKQAAENAQQTAEEARDAANAARDITQDNSDKLDRLIEARGNQTGNGAPGPGLVAVLAAFGLALIARRRA